MIILHLCFVSWVVFGDLIFVVAVLRGIASVILKRTYVFYTDFPGLHRRIGGGFAVCSSAPSTRYIDLSEPTLSRDYRTLEMIL